MDPSQSRIFGYLTQFIGNMKVDKVRRFLRFVTGSSALVVKEMCRFQYFVGFESSPHSTYLCKLHTTLDELHHMCGVL